MCSSKGIHTKSSCSCCHRSEYWLKGPHAHCLELLLDGWCFSIRMWHYPRSLVHGLLLLHSQVVRWCACLLEEYPSLLHQWRRFQLEFRNRIGSSRRIQRRRRRLLADSKREIQVGILLPVMALQMLHHEQEASPGLGDLHQHGNIQWKSFSTKPHRQWLLQDGLVLLRNEGFRCSRKTRCWSRILGG